MSTTAPASYEVGNIVHVPPGELLLERNIRAAAVVDDAFRDSIRDVGVIQPIVAVLNAEGRLVVRTGHRRTMAAVELGLPTVAVYVEGVDGTDRDHEVRRLLEQHDENTARSGLTAADELHMVDQLVAFGISAADIAAGYRMSRERVDQAIRVSASKLASKAAGRATFEEVTLQQLAGVAEFEDDSDTASKLLAVAKERPDQFDHVLQRERDDRGRELIRATKTTELEADGTTVVALVDGRLPDGVLPLDRLRDTETGNTVTARSHKKCPGNAAYVRVEPTVVDGVRTMVGHTEWVCTAGATYHRDSYRSSAGNPAGRVAADETDAETDAEREKRQAARRLVIENNKAWEASEPVRREWLKALTGRKTPPKGWASLVVHALGDRHTRWLLHEDSGLNIATQLGFRLEVDVDKDGPLATLLLVLAAYEGNLTRDSWREDGKHSDAGRYLRYLDSIGYPLSDVELYATSSKKA